MKETTIFIADDRKKTNSYSSTFFTFHKKTFPSCGSPYIFQNFSFRRFDSARPLLVRFF
nr:MAG TPA: hypothetical protein [Caudoviricetes sp.]